MNTAYFVEEEPCPDEPKLRKALSKLYPAYKEIRELTEACNYEWKYYGRKIGWQLKATRKGKALFYLTPLEESFRIAFVVKKQERELLLDSKLSTTVKRQLESARKYPEGYPLRLELTKIIDIKTIRVVLEVLKESV